jgi:hypothetical protein
VTWHDVRAALAYAPSRILQLFADSRRTNGNCSRANADRSEPKCVAHRVPRQTEQTNDGRQGTHGCLPDQRENLAHQSEGNNNEVEPVPSLRKVEASERRNLSRRMQT